MSQLSSYRCILIVATSWLVVAIVIPFPGSVTANAVKPATLQIGVQDGGSWSSALTTQDVPVHVSLMPDGRILYWARDKQGDGWDTGGQSNTYAVEPFYFDDPNYTDTILNSTTNLFCSGHSFLPDGRLIVSGGHRRNASFPSKEGIGEDTINIFDYRTSQWTLSSQHMQKGRWYPYNVTLANGETLIASGSYWDSVAAPTPVPTPNYDVTVRDLQGNLRTLTADDKYDGESQYPYISLTPANKVFSARTDPSKNDDPGPHLLDPYALNPNTGGPGVSEILPRPVHFHREGSSVQYAPGKVLLVAGSVFMPGGPKTPMAEVMDLNLSTPAWTAVGSLNIARQLPTATLLPDGKVLLTGGTNCTGYNNVGCGSVQTPELWDPANPTVWLRMNPTISGEPRVYHSVALLMPDARVMVGGGGLPAATGEVVPNLPPQVGTTTCMGSTPETFPEACRRFGHKSIEFFSPPYLYDQFGQPARRPAIASAPESIAYGQQFVVNVGNVPPAEIKNVVLVRLPSVTHTYNQDQRRVDLGAPVAINGMNITVKAPTNGVACPPGPYMLFLISKNGRNTPSIARIVRVGDLSISSSTSFFDSAQTFPPVSSGTMSGTVTVKAPAGVSWVAQVITPGSSWVAIQNGSGSGNGSFSFTVAENAAMPNFTVPSRVARIRVSVPGRDAIGLDYVVYQSGNFVDVPQGSTYYSFASKIYARGVTGGCFSSPAQFCPEGTLTRGQGAVFISALLHPLPLKAPRALHFTDVPTTNGFARFIEYLARRKIIEGCEPSRFCIDEPLTRKDMIVWLLRALGVDNPPRPTSSSFADVSVDDPASPFIEEGLRRNITAGCGGGNYCPNQSILRGQMAVFFSQTFGL
jgi:hypothetical protein